MSSIVVVVVVVVVVAVVVVPVFVPVFFLLFLALVTPLGLLAGISPNISSVLPKRSSSPLVFALLSLVVFTFFFLSSANKSST